MSAIVQAENRESVVLSATGIYKNFGPNEVLHGVDLDLRAGEVHALLGENGAGKSTFVKILSGYEVPSKGHLSMGDVVCEWDSDEAEAAGVILIHQEFNLAEQMTVEESIFLGREITKGPFLNKTEMQRLSREYLDALDCKAEPQSRIHDLPIADKQMVEIAKATSRNAKVLILDEPTAVLTGKETEVLFKLIERLKAQGVAIVYISHKLEEIERIADKITILRDGTWVGSYPAADLSKDDMARLMVGRELKDLYPEIKHPAVDAPIAMSIEGFASEGQFEAATFELREGEVLGFAGLVGAGRTALMEAIVGLDPQSTGAMALNGKPVTFKGLDDARKYGVAYLTKDRKEKGLLQSLGMCPNFSLFSLHKFSNILIDARKEKEAFNAAVKTFDIRSGDLSVNVGSLSGGNQQKLLLAKVMEVAPRVVIIDEPTRGIDVGTKSQIYHFISELAASGHSIILLSSEMTEIIGLSHRVAVMCAGRLTAVLEGDDIEEHEIMRYATGLKGN